MHCPDREAPRARSLSHGARLASCHRSYPTNDLVKIGVPATRDFAERGLSLPGQAREIVGAVFGGRGRTRLRVVVPPPASRKSLVLVPAAGLPAGAGAPRPSLARAGSATVVAAASTERTSSSSARTVSAAPASVAAAPVRAPVLPGRERELIAAGVASGRDRPVVVGREGQLAAALPARTGRSAGPVHRAPPARPGRTSRPEPLGDPIRPDKRQRGPTAGAMRDQAPPRSGGQAHRRAARLARDADGRVAVGRRWVAGGEVAPFKDGEGVSASGASAHADFGCARFKLDRASAVRALVRHRTHRDTVRARLIRGWSTNPLREVPRRDGLERN